ncbi:SusE domain-containing protein [Flavobacterium rhizosphaerae]|uniref:SusE domain-containing protein n=1 Tax=Flavobacterium rhizosphaerae TaxID=3163298 RepID=A0ABW8YZF0_9FLAO
MKKIFSLSLLTVLFLSIVSCSSDDNKIIIDKSTTPVLIAPASGDNIVINPNAMETTALTLVWDHAAYTESTEINYTVDIAVAGTDFTAPLEIGSTTDRFLLLTGERLKSLLTNATDAGTPGLGLPDTEDALIEVRVTATIGDNDDLPMVSDPLALSITFGSGEVIEEPQDPVLYLVGAPQAYYGLDAWSPVTAIPMRYIGDGTTQVFEAYVKVGAGDGFKFVSAQADWGDLEGNYGTIGGAQDGNLENSGGSGDIKVAEADGDGQYYVWVDMDAMQYKAVKMQWGIIGDSTPGGWSDETPMTYDFATNTWSVTATLTAAELKFRSANTGTYIANDAWKFNVGNSDPMVTYDPSAGNFTVTAGSHDITLMIDFTGTATVTGI